MANKELEKADEQIVAESIAKAETQPENTKQPDREKEVEIIENIKEETAQKPAATEEEPKEEDTATEENESKQENSTKETEAVAEKSVKSNAIDVSELREVVAEMKDIIKSFIATIKEQTVKKVDMVEEEAAKNKENNEYEKLAAELESVKKAVEAMRAEPAKNKVVLYERDYVAKTDTAEKSLESIQKELDEIMNIKKNDPIAYAERNLAKRAFELVDLKKALKEKMG